MGAAPSGTVRPWLVWTAGVGMGTFVGVAVGSSLALLGLLSCTGDSTCHSNEAPGLAAVSFAATTLAGVLLGVVDGAVTAVHLRRLPG